MRENITSILLSWLGLWGRETFLKGTANNLPKMKMKMKMKPTKNNNKCRTFVNRKANKQFYGNEFFFILFRVIISKQGLRAKQKKKKHGGKQKAS